MAAVAVAALLAAACGGDDARRQFPTATSTVSGSPTASAVTTVTDPVTELRVAYINLQQPVSLDATDTSPADTRDARLAIVVDELLAFGPDIVVVSEASIGKDWSVISTLIRELKMEYSFFQANPWLPGQTEREAGELGTQTGFKEGEAILTSHRYAVLKSEVHQVNPRTSEVENRSVGHVVLKGPAEAGEIDVYVTHLTGGTDATRAEQAADIRAWIEGTRGNGTVIVLGDLSEVAGSATHTTFVDGGLVDTGSAVAGPPSEGTCCREAIIGEQAPLAQTTAFIFTNGLQPISLTTFATTPVKQVDGTMLYASDQNGLQAVFALSPVGE
ncbi:MAG TPA: hypothetical protein VFK32_01055 [Tepidiformaceae bacterium]|nr:hypothetical protein [Tepidiformaceae bacterium]